MVQSQTNPSTSTNLTHQPQDQGFVELIKSDLAEFSSAFSNHDIKTAASFFAPDATLINPAGTRAVGRDKLSQVMQDDWNSFLKGTRSEFRFENCRMLADDLAFVDLHMDIKGARTPDGKEMPMGLHVAVVMKKMGDRWKWLECRPYSFMQPPQASVH